MIGLAAAGLVAAGQSVLQEAEGRDVSGLVDAAVPGTVHNPKGKLLGLAVGPGGGVSQVCQALGRRG